MEKSKYIIIKIRGHEVAIVFHELIEHKAVASFDMDVISAGFVTTYIVSNNLIIQVWGRSESLNKNSRPQDNELIQETIQKKGR